MGALPSAGILAWHRFFTERSDKRTETVAELRDRVRSTMDVQSLAMYDRLEGENKRLVARLREMEAEKRELERDRNRGWDLARWWEEDDHRTKHRLLNTVHAANLRLETNHLAPVEVPRIFLPKLEEPKPDGQQESDDG